MTRTPHFASSVARFATPDRAADEECREANESERYSAPDGSGLEVIAHPLLMERRLRHCIESEPLNMELKTAWIGLQRALASADIRCDQKHRAVERLNRASKAVNEMLYFDPTNESWLELRDNLDLDLLKLTLVDG